jgi:predicted membrane protein
MADKKEEIKTILDNIYIYIPLYLFLFLYSTSKILVLPPDVMSLVSNKLFRFIYLLILFNIDFKYYHVILIMAGTYIATMKYFYKQEIYKEYKKK